ncbi:nicotinate-nucleotide--dimethylbenzimidazole phosphoribosyltransferase [Parasporobacterium paucivorans]|uniref:Nicotinate-nucleotide--dimethylbenzimidazole phosphoribosyltransferase n=1 Tax=Parasporobacterium paucivorans DSM 15970 TaxID=1122934 RepID=A0A1M6KI65_9FIRM|nr:nicotinate-nucleotide--dimethylbenzimidazole phosphoribosyltransferase [Parasporobacterium paucivorans]SHJ58638.1 nicotinate-nucleotide-dimethylbenzimidazole phosphoribosyltransferase [Parasporobacterium paucivorans DSM 15970]
MKLNEALELIRQPDSKAMDESRKRWDSIAKPLRSLGRMEEAVIKIAGIAGDSQVVLDKKAHVVMCGDNGVVEEGVSQSGSEVTAIVAENFLQVKSCVSIMCRMQGVDLFPVDVGMCSETRIIPRKIAYGTKNMAKEPAMTRQQAVDAIEVGIDMVRELKEKGYNLIGTGEMGIGNTTTSSAVTSALLGVDVESVTGKGAGLSSSALNKKIQVIKNAIELHRPDPLDPVDVLAKVGGFDIAGLMGVFIGGAAFRVPVVIDGFISSVSALLASRLDSRITGYMLASHVSQEPASVMLLEELGLNPLLVCDMRLGEGTGAVASFPILDIALEIYNKMSTFEQIELDAYEELE